MTTIAPSTEAVSPWNINVCHGTCALSEDTELDHDDWHATEAALLEWQDEAIAHMRECRRCEDWSPCVQRDLNEGIIERLTKRLGL